MHTPSRAAQLVRRCKRALFATVWSLLAINAAWAAPGDLDPWFGMAPGEIGVSPGFVELDYVGASYLARGDNRAMTTDAHGRILVVESWHTDYVSTRAQSVVRRLNADGTPDPTWGVAGLVTLPEVGFSEERRYPFASIVPNVAITAHNLTLENFNGTLLTDAQGFTLALQAPQHVLVAVGVGQNIHVFAYRNNGQLDTQFGPMRDGHALLTLPNRISLGMGMAVHRGHITLVSSIDDRQDLSPTQYVRRMLIGRMSTNGMPPARGAAVATYAIDDRNHAFNRLTNVAVNPFTQELYACGRYMSSEQADLSAADPGSATMNLVLARLNEQGAPDPSFGSGGFVIHGMPRTGYYVYRLAFQSNGRILLAGVTQTSEFARASIWAFQDNGRLDASFGTAGVAEVPSPFGYGTSLHNGLMVDDQDRIYAGGGLTVSIPTKIPGEPIYAREGFLARLTAEGRLDAGFGNYYNYYNPGSPRLSVINSSRDCDRLAWSRGAPLCMGDEALYPTDRGRLRVYKFQP